MDGTLVCWKCGAALTDLLLPLARQAECPACRADLHVCRLCTFYDTGVANQCREPVAEAVGDKTRANFCGYFQPRPDAWRGAGGDTDGRARAALDALFGGGAAPAGTPADPEDQARAALERLFGDK